MSFCAGIDCTEGAFFNYKLFYMMVQRALFEDVETSIAKRPSEYGKGYIEERYRVFRNQFFDGDAGNLPERMPIGYSSTMNYPPAKDGWVSNRPSKVMFPAS